MAINRSWRDAQTNEMREEVTFVDVDAFGRSAETIAQYLKKGRPILIEGRLKLDTWDDKQTNQKRSKLGIVLESFQFLDAAGQGQGREGGTPSENRPSRPAASAPMPPPPSEPEGMPPEEDDVPF
jgi:single-strand DNA-binding protein